MNLDSIEQIVAVLGEFPVSEITVERDGQRIYARRPLVLAAPELPSLEASGRAAAALPPGTESPTEPAPAPPRTLLAPMVGIFHQAQPPLSFSAPVRVGQVIGYIESMKLMNEVLAEDVGKITDVLTEDGAPVEYGQPLFRIAP